MRRFRFGKVRVTIIPRGPPNATVAPVCSSRTGSTATAARPPQRVSWGLGSTLLIPAISSLGVTGSGGIVLVPARPGRLSVAQQCSHAHHVYRKLTNYAESDVGSAYATSTRAAEIWHAVRRPGPDGVGPARPW